MTSASQVQRKRLFPGEHDLAREVPDIAFEASQVQPSFVLPVLECLDRSPPLIESIQHRRASALPAVKRESSSRHGRPKSRRMRIIKCNSSAKLCISSAWARGALGSYTTYIVYLLLKGVTRDILYMESRHTPTNRGTWPNRMGFESSFHHVFFTQTSLALRWEDVIELVEG